MGQYKGQDSVKKISLHKDLSGTFISELAKHIYSTLNFNHTFAIMWLGGPYFGFLFF